MNKFLITGLRRSGTTLISSILNTNHNISCIEYSLMSMKDIHTTRDLNVYNSHVFDDFVFFDINPPILDKIPLKKEDKTESILIILTSIGFF